MKCIEELTFMSVRVATLTSVLLAATVGTLFTVSAWSTNPPPPQREHWLWPTGTPVKVTRVFDPPSMPWLSGHRGVDLDAQVGSTIFSPANGTVIFAGKVVDREVLSIMHAGGVRSTYEPISASVSAGDQVNAGDPIGVVQEGHFPGPLHWGARFQKNQYIDPLRMLIGPSILKPW